MPTTTLFHWDEVSDSVLQESDGAGDVQVTYTNEPSAYGPLLSERRGTVDSQYHFDALGSTRALTDNSQSVTDTFTYDAWGNMVLQTGAMSTPWKWNGQWQAHSSRSNLFYFRRRMYSEVLGLWLSADPVDATAERYRAFDNTPVLRNDPSRVVATDINIVFISKVLPKCPNRRGEVVWQFHLFQPAPCNGFIIQKVDVTCRMSACDADSPAEKPYSYWEAWPVMRGRKTAWKALSRDTARCPVQNCQKGVYQQETELRFFCNTAVGLQESPPEPSIPGWKPSDRTPDYHPDDRHPCKTQAGVLTSTGNRPDFWDLQAEPGPGRLFLQDWQCCPAEAPCCGSGEQRAHLTYVPF
jgi:RHS repeat-associated protein